METVLHGEARMHCRQRHEQTGRAVGLETRPPDQSFTPTSVKRNPAGVLVKTKMSSPQKMK